MPLASYHYYKTKTPYNQGFHKLTPLIIPRFFASIHHWWTKAEGSKTPCKKGDTPPEPLSSVGGIQQSVSVVKATPFVINPLNDYRPRRFKEYTFCSCRSAPIVPRQWLHPLPSTFYALAVLNPLLTCQAYVPNILQISLDNVCELWYNQCRKTDLI